MLFIEELGWDRYARNVDIEIEGHTFTAKAFAEKRGVQIFECSPDSNGNIPERSICRKIDKEIGKTAHERLVIFVDKNKDNQFWLWVSKEPGKPTCYRGHDYNIRQDNYLPLIQKLNKIAFTLSEEEALSIFGVTMRLRDAFDRERLTRRFYDLFKTEHKAFLDLISGIPDSDMQRWYASVMISRIMFIYFIQENRFLDNDPRYLRNQLEKSASNEKDRYYGEFLCPLFFEGFAKREEDRSADVRKLLGIIPYLNGGLFTRHQIEEQFAGIQIPDAAFERIFTFFDGYRWHLDERPLADGREINPDVLGYIFEKYINQKQMGAYYTKEDITEYIGKNTIIPYLFDVAQKQCAVAFEGDQSVWRILQTDPDRYLYDAVKRGVIDESGNVIPETALPDFVQQGMHDPKARMFERRYNLEPAVLLDSEDNNLALPTETWREYVERRTRCLELRNKLQTGEVRSINDLITYNLNIRQFAQDVIDSSEGPELLRAIWHAIVGRIPEKSDEKFVSGITILDPTCGSGAFLFAALNILEPLYEACLDRMEAFVAEFDRSSDKAQQAAHGKYADFRRELARVDEHPNRRYFIMKSIIVNNLYGVDIMDEAVEICKLRLFLKLVAQVEKDDYKPNLGIEPLPDIDFNIRAGNTLVGFATKDEVKEAVTHAEAGQMKLLMGEDDTLNKIEEMADMADRAFKRFRQQQTQHEATPKDMAEAKSELKKRLSSLENELNLYLAKEYGISVGKKGDSAAFEKWLESYKPFHWFIEFYGIMKQGGFDVIIGNPPYKDLKSAGQDHIIGYKTQSTKNLYPLCMERALRLGFKAGRTGLIVPVSSISTEGYLSLQQILFEHSGHWSSFDDRPSRLFDGLEHIQLTIHLINNETSNVPLQYFTECMRWSSDEREILFSRINYSAKANGTLVGTVPKIGRKIEHEILSALDKNKVTLGMLDNRTGRNLVYYSRKVHNFLQVLDFIPEVYSSDGSLREPSELKSIRCITPEHAALSLCALNSSLFRWYINVYTDCRHVNKREVEAFSILVAPNQPVEVDIWLPLATKLSRSLHDFSEFRNMKFKHDHLRVQCIIPKKSKSIIDEIELKLGGHYGLSDECIDFLVNYDIKYRMGLSVTEEDSDD